MRICFVLCIGLATFATLCSARPAENDADYDEEPAPPPKKPSRPLTSRRNPLNSRSNAKPASSTTTTTVAPEEEEIVDEGDYDEEPPAEQEASSTTEAPKKNFLKTGVVRPFRSNDELLAALKKRREQAATNKVHKPIQSEDQSAPAVAAVEPEAPKKSTAASSGRRNRFNSKEKIQESGAEEAAPVKSGRRFGGRS
ncbi:uncharacterized protein LOC130448734 [Diorhabda sublineata]|uniref:uncharacterized protein LOC130448734 n=1 Tax=Diorhabda sublineata TaxID=1163346 RepID=UPI0024E153E9|nr:uncharacterized protein LOC130448734 [Diorhabda sublineata]